MAILQLYSIKLSVDFCDKLSLIAHHSIKLREVMTPVVAFMVSDTLWYLTDVNADTNFEPISGCFRLWWELAKPKGSFYPTAAQTTVIAPATTKRSRHYNQ